MQCSKIRPVVKKLLAETGISLSEGGGIPQLIILQEHFRQYSVTVYRGLACEDIIFEGQVDSPKKINLLYDDVEQHYHVIVNISCAMAKMNACNPCKQSSASVATHHCEQTSIDCRRSPPWAFKGFHRLPCTGCNIHLRSQTFIANHKEITSNKKPICERKRCCKTCGALLSGMPHDCSKRYCHTCKQNRATGHLCYMRTLKNALPVNAENVLYIFYDFETTQNKTYSDTAKNVYLNLSACN